MKLKDLIDYDLDIDIKGIVDDSRLVKDGYIFVATKGFNVDHYDHIKDAIDNGCVFLITDREIDFSFPHIIVDNIDEYYKNICLKFYDINLNDFSFIGITGTDGKTTTAEAGIKTVVMEVSSEALLHNRVDNILFDIIGFTNITGDHLNIHGSFDNYKKCKMKLLNLIDDDSYIVINGDDVNLQEINCKNMYSFGKKNVNFTIKNISYVNKNVLIVLKYKGIEYSITSPLKGEYNVYNVVMAFIISLLYGVDSDELIENIKKLTPISGRCEELDFGQDYTIILDYAHTTNGIENILNTFKDYDRIITVTGCAGGREHEKRPIIGNIVMSKSDISIFTMDDPRNEDVDTIIDEMVGDNTDYIRIIDREEAINYALSIASKGDVVLILGKGRDNYMAIGNEKVKYNDYDVIKKYFEK